MLLARRHNARRVKDGEKKEKGLEKEKAGK